MITKEELEPYQDREHALVKHKLFQSYLERFVMILGRRVTKLAYVDAFAGPWKSQSKDYSDTSFGRAVSVLRSSQLALEKSFNAKPRLRAAFYEKDAVAFSELHSYAIAQSTSGLSLEARNERFEESVEKISAWIERDEFSFILVDPKGYEGLVEPSTLSVLLENPKVELLINYMWQFLNLATGHAGNAAHNANLVKMFGEGFEELLSLPPAEKEYALIRRYMQRLRDACPRQGGKRLRAISFPIEYADKKGTKYYLVYATHNAVGLSTFAQEMEKASKHQGLLKALVYAGNREKKTNNFDLFSPVQIDTEPHRSLQNNPWLDVLVAKGDQVIVDQERWADLLEQYNCYPSDLQAALGLLIGEGVVEVVGVGVKRGRKRNFVHPKKCEIVRRLR